MENCMKLEISAIGENESFARSAVAAFALPLNPTLSELSDVKTAVSEAVTNCVVHAYNTVNAKNKIIIECRVEKETRGGILHITISDAGCGISNVEQAQRPFFSTATSGERSGMGFTIMQTFMDELVVCSEVGQGTQVKMKKYIVGCVVEMQKERVDA